MADFEKVVRGMECCISAPYDCGHKCPYFEADGCIAQLKIDALSLLKYQHMLLEHEKKDMNVINGIRSGKIKKHVEHDYTIYNGDWYREHPWFTPEGGELLRAFLMDMEASNSIINTVNIHNMSFDDASRILMLCGPACDLLSPKGFIRWLKEKMMGDPRIREEVISHE